MINLKGTRYVEFRNSKLGDIYSYPVQERSLKFNTLIETISNHTLSASTPSSNSFAFVIDNERFYKSISTELELFHAKAYIQKINLTKINELDPTWKFVSVYYYGFYSATSLLRINRCGIIFLNRSKATLLQHIATSLIGSLVNIGDGAYVYSANPISATQTEILLTKEGGNTHQKVWRMTFNFLESYLSLNTTMDDEYTLLTKIIALLKKNKEIFISTARNRINYQGPTIVDSINGLINHEIDIISYDDQEVFKKLMSFDLKAELRSFEIERFSYLYSALLHESDVKLYLKSQAKQELLR